MSQAPKLPIIGLCLLLQACHSPSLQNLGAGQWSLIPRPKSRKINRGALLLALSDSKTPSWAIKNTRNNLTSLQQTLVQCAGFEQVTTLKGRRFDRSSIRNAITEASQNLPDNGTLLIYILSHAFGNSHSPVVFTYYTNPERATETLRLEDILVWLGPRKRLILLTEICGTPSLGSAQKLQSRAWTPLFWRLSPHKGLVPSPPKLGLSPFVHSIVSRAHKYASTGQSCNVEQFFSQVTYDIARASDHSLQPYSHKPSINAKPPIFIPAVRHRLGLTIRGHDLLIEKATLRVNGQLIEYKRTRPLELSKDSEISVEVPGFKKARCFLKTSPKLHAKELQIELAPLQDFSPKALPSLKSSSQITKTPIEQRSSASPALADFVTFSGILDRPLLPKAPFDPAISGEMSLLSNGQLGIEITVPDFGGLYKGISKVTKREHRVRLRSNENKTIELSLTFPRLPKSQISYPENRLLVGTLTDNDKGRQFFIRLDH